MNCTPAQPRFAEPLLTGGAVEAVGADVVLDADGDAVQLAQVAAGQARHALLVLALRQAQDVQIDLQHRVGRVGHLQATGESGA